jgi:hypothetical protein
MSDTKGSSRRHTLTEGNESRVRAVPPSKFSCKGPSKARTSEAVSPVKVHFDTYVPVAGGAHFGLDTDSAPSRVK